jgi:hypothetical protein
VELERRAWAGQVMTAKRDVLRGGVEGLVDAAGGAPDDEPFQDSSTEINRERQGLTLVHFLSST